MARRGRGFWEAESADGVARWDIHRGTESREEGAAVRGGGAAGEGDEEDSPGPRDHEAFAQRSTSTNDGRRNQPRENAGPSYLLPHLEEQERILMEMVVDGDMTIVQNFLNQHPTLNINCKDFQGLSPLALAVRDGDLAMVDLLLSRPAIDVGDCALRAAQTGDPHVLLLLLEKLREGGREGAGCVGSPDFADGTTPLLVAAQGNHYDSVALLLARGHELPRPHAPRCKCETCAEEATRDDQLSVAKQLLALYRAWTSPAFLCHSSEDPILDAFLLACDLQRWSRVMTPYLKDYLDLAHKARRFAADLLGCCRTLCEVRLVLRQRGGSWCASATTFPRLVMAMHLEQKEFVAHPNAQLAIWSAWCGDWGSWRLRSAAWRALALLVRVPLLPWVAVVTLAAPSSTLGRHYATPLNKFLSDVASYVVFLALVFVESNLDKRWQLRGPPSSGVEPLIVLWVVGQMWSSTRMCFIEGPRTYFSMLSSWYDAMTQLLFVTTFLFWLASWLDVSANGQRALERKFWHWLDPTLLAEGFFVLASIFAFGRLTILFKFSVILGPLQVAVENMLKDMAKFFFLFAFILICFSWGLSRFYQYYDGMSQKDASGASSTQARSFVSFRRTLVTLFWCIFCMTPLEAADVVIENMPGDAHVYNHHHFTQAVGYLCFAMFLVVTVIVLLNMLVATIVSTYQKVTNSIDIEWTFGQTQTMLVYFSQTTLPPPLNLIPTVGCVGNFFKWMVLKCRRRDAEKPRALWSVMEDLPAAEDPRAYASLLAALAQRYFRQNEDAAALSSSGLSPATADMENLRREVRLLRASLLPGLEEAMATARSTAESALAADSASMEDESPSLASSSESATLTEFAALVARRSVAGVPPTQREASPASSESPSHVFTPTRPITGPHSGTSVPDPSLRNQHPLSESSVSVRDESPTSIIPIREVYASASILVRDKVAVTTKESSIGPRSNPQDEDNPALPPQSVPSTGNVKLAVLEPRRSCMELSHGAASEILLRRQRQRPDAVESGDFHAARRSVQRRRRTRGSRTRESHRLDAPPSTPPPRSPRSPRSPSDEELSGRPPPAPLRLRSRSRPRLGRHRPRLLTMREEDESAEAEVASLVDLVERRASSSSPLSSKHDESTQESMLDFTCDVVFESDPDVTCGGLYGRDVSSPVDAVYCSVHRPSASRMEMGIGDDVDPATEESDPPRQLPHLFGR